MTSLIDNKNLPCFYRMEEFILAHRLEVSVDRRIRGVVLLNKNEQFVHPHAQPEPNAQRPMRYTE